MKAKILIVLGAIMLFTCAVFLNEYSHNPMAWCFSDHDTCAIKAMNDLHAQKDKAHADNKAQFEAAEKSIDDHYNPILEAIKPTISVGAALKEAKEGDKRNVPAEILTLKSVLIPNAMADTGTAIINGVETTIKSGDEATRIIFDDNLVNLQRKDRLTQFLKSKNSPFADVDVLKYGREAGLTEQQTALLLGISLKESGWGTDYTSTRKGYYESVPEMASIYHNPVGLKWCTLGESECPEPNRKPDENGMWVQKYDSYDQFWQTYTKQMKSGYFDRGGNDPATISRWYVGDDKELAKKLGKHYVKQDWADVVTGGMNEVLDAIIK